MNKFCSQEENSYLKYILFIHPPAFNLGAADLELFSVK